MSETLYAEPNCEQLTLEKRIEELGDYHGISNSEYVNKVLEEVEQSRAIELTDDGDKEMECYLFEFAYDCLHQDYDFIDPCKETLKYGEFLFLFINSLITMAKDPELGESSIERQSLAVYCFIDALRYLSGRNATLKKLMGLNHGALKREAYKRYIEKATVSKGDCSMLEASKLSQMQYADDTRSFLEVVKTLDNAIRRSWMPFDSIHKFRSSILESYKAIMREILMPLTMGCLIMYPIYSISNENEDA